MATTKTKLTGESLAAERNAHKGTPALDVVSWLHESEFGVLGTLSTEDGSLGYPTGSVVPFCVDSQGRPVIFVADIALHTRNLLADNRASLFVHDPHTQGDPQSSWRASINGRFERLSTSKEPPEGSASITETEFEQIMARYVLRVPNARSYARTHAFYFWRMNHIESIRYIAGFGRICSFAGSDYLAEVSEEHFAKVRKGAIEHMNEDHEQNMVEICRAFHGVEPKRVTMASLERTGCLFETHEPAGFYFSPFSKVVQEPSEFKSLIIDLLRRARKTQRS